MIIPNAEGAIVDRAKLEDYLLSPSHPVGRFKARFFERLGFSQVQWRLLEAALREHLVEDAEAGVPDEHGRPFTIRAILEGPTGVSARIVSVWFIRTVSATLARCGLGS